MKLPRPFFRLPVRFDVERLRAEVEALPAAAWSRHPQEYPGNTAARLTQMYGPAYRVTLRPRADDTRGTIAEITLPFRESTRVGGGAV